MITDVIIQYVWCGMKTIPFAASRLQIATDPGRKTIEAGRLYANDESLGLILQSGAWGAPTHHSTTQSRCSVISLAYQYYEL